MKYNATVVSVDGKHAVVRYKINASCGGWSRRTLSQAERMRDVSADNEIGAKVGDKVVIHMPDMIDLLLSAKEQILPMIVGFIAMMLANSMFAEQLLAINSYVSFFVQIIIFFAVTALARKGFRKLSYNDTAKPKQSIKILEIVNSQAEVVPLQKVEFN